MSSVVAGRQEGWFCCSCCGHFPRSRSSARLALSPSRFVVSSTHPNHSPLVNRFLTTTTNKKGVFPRRSHDERYRVNYSTTLLFTPSTFHPLEPFLVVSIHDDKTTTRSRLAPSETTLPSTSHSRRTTSVPEITFLPSRSVSTVPQPSTSTPRGKRLLAFRAQSTSLKELTRSPLQTYTHCRHQRNSSRLSCIRSRRVSPQWTKLATSFTWWRTGRRTRSLSLSRGYDLVHLLIQPVQQRLQGSQISHQ